MRVYSLDTRQVAGCMMDLDECEVVPNEFEELAQVLLEEGLMSYRDGIWRITDEGHGYLYNVNAPRPDSS